MALFVAATAHAGGGRKLRNATADQDARFRTAFDVVNGWIQQGAFPGAVLAVGQHGSLVALKAFGHTEYVPGAPPMAVDEIFDLASLSKVIGTTSAAAYLYDRGRLELDTRVVDYVPEFAGTQEHDRVTIRELLTHSSGIPTPRLFYKFANDKDGILRQIYTVPLASPPGTQFVYRDPNFILLGDIVERVSGKKLNEILQRHVFGPLGMRSTEYRPSANLISRTAPTEIDDILRHHLVRGEVHDENCLTMGGVCGHAGLFSSAGDLAIYAQMMLNGGQYRHRRIFQKSTVDLFTRRQNIPDGSSRALGWDTPASKSFAGSLASSRAILHTGFTGTSIYVDFEREAFIVLLTNRVNPTRDNNKINEARPDIHTAVIVAFRDPQ
ncbi:MAG: hypothetical protein JWO80_5256 [Bryobacterales bacterium]|nr:hypothetical protein [Bryobacterales bacterium]